MDENKINEFGGPAPHVETCEVCEGTGFLMVPRSDDPQQPEQIQCDNPGCEDGKIANFTPEAGEFYDPCPDCSAPSGVREGDGLALSEEYKTAKVGDSVVEILTKEEGDWLHFNDGDGHDALIWVGGGTITKRAVRNVVEDLGTACRTYEAGH